MNLETLMKAWAAKYDPIVDINEELKDVQDCIETYRKKNRANQLKEQEEKLALLLQIIEAQKG